MQETFTFGGKTYEEADLLEVGMRVSPWAIRVGYMKEIPIRLNGELRYLPLLTRKGVEYASRKIREEITNGTFGNYVEAEDER